MLTNDEVANRSYRFMNNLMNAAWLTGYIYQLSQDRRSFYIRQSGFATGIFLVEIDKGDYLPQMYQEGSGIKIFARVFANTNHKSVTLRVLNIQQPSISELPKPDDDNDDKNDIYADLKLEKPYGKAVNNVSVAGFLDNLIFEQNSKGEKNSEVLLLDLRIGTEMIIPVRIYGKRCQIIYDSVKKLTNRGKFYPIVFNCSLRSRLLKNIEGEDPIIQTYLHSNNITFMDNQNVKNYFQGKPTWIHKLMES